MARLTPEEMMDDVVKSLAEPKWNYSLEPNGWFFPNDASPHSQIFKYRCKKLCELGLLERQGGSGRWGYRYRVPVAIPKEVEDAH